MTGSDKTGSDALTQSAGSTPFPFNSLWLFSSLVLSLEITGSNTVVRSGNSDVRKRRRYEKPSLSAKTRPQDKI